MRAFVTGAAPVLPTHARRCVCRIAVAARNRATDCVSHATTTRANRRRCDEIPSSVDRRIARRAPTRFEAVAGPVDRHAANRRRPRQAQSDSDPIFATGSTHCGQTCKRRIACLVRTPRRRRQSPTRCDADIRRRRGRRTSARPRCDPTFIGGRIAAMREKITAHRTGSTHGDPTHGNTRAPPGSASPGWRAPKGVDPIRGRSRTRHGRSITTARTI